MRTQRFITIVCLLLWTVAHLHAYEKRDLLQKEADFEKVKSALIMEQKWVPYPDYSDRAGWDKLLGDYKEKYIRKGESYLDYEWKVVKATDYLEFGRSGDRRLWRVRSVKTIPHSEVCSWQRWLKGRDALSIRLSMVFLQVVK